MLIRLAAKVAVFMLTLAVSVTTVVQLSEWWTHLEWMTVLSTNLATTRAVTNQGTPDVRAPYHCHMIEQCDVWTLVQKQQEELKEIRALRVRLLCCDHSTSSISKL
eukprot:Blabericola_migrator_1__8942@NODE_4741_length_998_cov_27_914071_g2951_i0_p1_GENE_NODE_4741_length_998_cov_27_914071_g2951_i0NODE_4741_length_998_cov_27_914071_g2951_i0_p1_ORF_typecomplete_len106_score11_06_NODE_4741_length_998_cov_27_914071_g2951_i0492809